MDEASLGADAVLHAFYEPHAPVPEHLRAAGYRRWINERGDVRVMRRKPSHAPGVWRHEPLN